MAAIGDLLSRVRLELGDQQTQFTFTSVGDGVTKSFYLEAKPVEISTLYVTINGTAVPYRDIAQVPQYSLEASTGILTFVTAPTNNAIVVVHGTQDRYFLDSELTGFINTAVTQHSYNRTDAFGSAITMLSIPPVEEYPLAILASIEALWVLATDSAFDINISAPDGVVIPRNQRYQQLTGIIAQRWDQYHQLCSALNIGLNRLEMGTLRRVSRLTNKLVPIYMAQEIDDSRKPERVYIQNDLLGRTPLPEYSGVYDIQVTQGDSWSQQFNFPFDVTGLDFKAQIRTYPNAPSLYATFTISKIDPANGLIQLTLDPSATAYLPTRAFWDLQATQPGNDAFEQTYIKGQVFVQQQVTLD